MEIKTVNAISNVNMDTINAQIVERELNYLKHHAKTIYKELNNCYGGTISAGSYYGGRVYPDIPDGTTLTDLSYVSDENWTRIFGSAGILRYGGFNYNQLDQFVFFKAYDVAIPVKQNFSEFDNKKVLLYNIVSNTREDYGEPIVGVNQAIITDDFLTELYNEALQYSLDNVDGAYNYYQVSDNMGRKYYEKEIYKALDYEVAYTCSIVTFPKGDIKWNSNQAISSKKFFRSNINDNGKIALFTVINNDRTQYCQFVLVVNNKVNYTHFGVVSTQFYMFN